MSTIKTGYGRSGFGDAEPKIDKVLRDVADDAGALKLGAPAAATAATVTTAAATDLATAQALANSLKAELNKLITDVAALRTVINTQATATIKTVKG